jgi:hypothetical protein
MLGWSTTRNSLLEHMLHMDLVFSDLVNQLLTRMMIQLMYLRRLASKAWMKESLSQRVYRMMSLIVGM